jgi:branched-chain amino acid transport system ATP-binding protein
VSMPSMLEIAGLQVRYGGVVAVEDVSLEVPSTACTGLIGPNGSGKTSLFNAVTGFASPAAGSVLWDGRDLTGKPPQVMVRAGVVRSFQQPMIFSSLTVTECLQAVVHSKMAALELLRLGELEQYQSASSSALPYGSMRKLGILLALALEPKLLMLDEPTSGLSNPEIASIVKLLTRLRERNIGLWLIDHNLHFIQSLCGTLVVLNAGRVLSAGLPQEVLRESAVQAAYIGTEKVLPEGGET